MPMATAREPRAAVEDGSLDPHQRLGGTSGPCRRASRARGPATAPQAAPRLMDQVVAEAVWELGRQAGPLFPACRASASAVAALSQARYPCESADLLAYQAPGK
jgi:hypothetical protein